MNKRLQELRLLAGDAVDLHSGCGCLVGIHICVYVYTIVEPDN
jgi:hypothetical protein